MSQIDGYTDRVFASAQYPSPQSGCPSDVRPNQEISKIYNPAITRDVDDLLNFDNHQTRNDNASASTVKSTKDLLKNTTMCEFYAKGKCTRGEKCMYAHDETLLRPKPKLYRTRLCQRFAGGRCKAGSECRFAHDAREVNRITSEESPQEDFVDDPIMEPMFDLSPFGRTTRTVATQTLESRIERKGPSMPPVYSMFVGPPGGLFQLPGHFRAEQNTFHITPPEAVAAHYRALFHPA